MDNILLGNKRASRWVIQLGDSHDRDVLEAEYEQIKQQVPAEDWCLIFIPVKDWFSDLTPWKVPPVWGKAGIWRWGDEYPENSSGRGDSPTGG